MYQFRGHPLLFIVATYLLVSSVILAVVAIHLSQASLNRAVEELHKEELHKELDTLALLLQSHVNTRLAQLRDHASDPLLTQGVMQPEQLGAEVADHLESLKLLGARSTPHSPGFSGRAAVRRVGRTTTDRHSSPVCARSAGGG